MGFLIDTCIWVDVERGAIAPADVASITGEEAVYLSPVTIAELRFGVENAKSPDQRLKRGAALARLKRKPVLPIDESTGEVLGYLAAELGKSGTGHRHRVQDIWIASQAIQHAYRLLTHNRADFSDIPGLLLVVWDDAVRTGNRR